MILITATGRLGKDAESRNAGKDTVVSFSVASEQRRGNEKATVWLDASIWGKRGQSLLPYLKKGLAVTVHGELTQREHNGKTYLGIRVEHIELQGGKATGSGGGSSGSSSLPDDRVDSGNSDDDSIPF